jgi:capsular exopolysaccharide synthesis family protein
MEDHRNSLERMPGDITFREVPHIQHYNARGVTTYQGFQRSGGSYDFNLRELWRIVRKRKWLVIGIAFLVTTLVTIEIFRTKSRYRALATIEIGKGSVSLIRSTEVLLQQEDPLPVDMKTTEVILKSAPLLEDVIVTLQLDQNSEFLDVDKKKSVWESLNDVAGNSQQNRDRPSRRVFTSAMVKPKADGIRSSEEAERLARFVEILEQSLVIEPIENTRALTISFTHTDPSLAAAVANGIADRFVEQSFENKIEKFTNASGWLDRSTRELKAKIEQAETALADYTGTHNIFSIEGKETLITEKLSRLHDQATRAETDRILKESLYEQVRQGRIAQVPEAFADPQTAELRRRLGELATTAAELSVSYGPKYPRMAEINQQMASIRDHIAASSHMLEEKLKADYERALRDEQALTAALAAAKTEAAQENQRAIQYSILKQDVDTTKSLYTEFLQKTNQAYLELAQQHSNIRVIAPARVPKKTVSPRRLRAILIALFLSLTAAIGLAFLLEYLDDTVRSIDDVARYVELPTLGVIPAISLGASGLFLREGKRRNQTGLRTKAGIWRKPAQISPVKDDETATNRILTVPRSLQAAQLMALDGRSAAAEAYRTLRTSVLLSAAGNPPKIILVTSGRPGEGKTTTTCNVAISLAQLGASVLIVDCDLRKPAVHRVFDIGNNLGLSTYLSQNIEIDGLIQESPVPNLSLLPSGQLPPNPAELISSNRMKEMLRLLATRYDHIVMDSPPLVDVTDPVILSTMAYGVILVIHSGKSSRHVVRHACHELSAVGARLFGVVLNNVDMRREGYDYYYFHKYPSKYSFHDDQFGEKTS